METKNIVKAIIKQKVDPCCKLILICLAFEDDCSKITLAKLVEETSLPTAKIKKALKDKCFDFCRDWCDTITKQKASDSALYNQECLRILLYLNTKAKTHYRNTNANLKFIKSRLDDGITAEEMMKVIDVQCDSWLNTQMEKYLRPETLFNATKFENYYNIACKNEIPQQTQEIQYSDDEMSIYCS